jgi:hypothetical protein
MWTAPSFPVNHANCSKIEKPRAFDRFFLDCEGSQKSSETWFGSS